MEQRVFRPFMAWPIWPVEPAEPSPRVLFIPVAKHVPKPRSRGACCWVLGGALSGSASGAGLAWRPLADDAIDLSALHHAVHDPDQSKLILVRQFVELSNELVQVVIAKQRVKSCFATSPTPPRSRPLLGGS